MLNCGEMRVEHIPAQSAVLCAVSGGADSVCLLHRLKERGDLRLFCAHYDHRLRGGESRRDADFVRRLCAAWDIPYFEGSGDVAAYAKSASLSTETAARVLRYAFLEKTAADCGADFIATAHTASDNAETMLLHLCRGSGTRGLGGIPPRRGQIIRPILAMTRSDVEDYLQTHSLPHVEDSSNALDEAARNRIRHHAIPAMKSVNEAFERSALRTARLLRADEEYLQGEARRALERIREGSRLSIPALLALPEALQLRSLQLMAGEGACCNKRCSAKDISYLYTLVSGSFREKQHSLSISQKTYTLFYSAQIVASPVYGKSSVFIEQPCQKPVLKKLLLCDKRNRSFERHGNIQKIKKGLMIAYDQSPACLGHVFLAVKFIRKNKIGYNANDRVDDFIEHIVTFP